MEESAWHKDDHHHTHMLAFEALAAFRVLFVDKWRFVQEYCVFAAVMNRFWCLVTDFTWSPLPGPRPVRAAEQRTFIFFFPNLAKNEASKPGHGHFFHFWEGPKRAWAVSDVCTMAFHEGGSWV
jgi:hypothetical protein